MGVKKLYGNPYTGFTNENRSIVEGTLIKIGKLKPHTISHKVHLSDRTYIWLTGKGKLK